MPTTQRRRRQRFSHTKYLLRDEAVAAAGGRKFRKEKDAQDEFQDCPLPGLPSLPDRPWTVPVRVALWIGDEKRYFFGGDNIDNHD